MVYAILKESNTSASNIDEYATILIALLDFASSYLRFPTTLPPVLHDLITGFIAKTFDMLSISKHWLLNPDQIYQLHNDVGLLYNVAMAYAALPEMDKSL